MNHIVQTGDPTGTGSGGSSIFGLTEGPAKRFFDDEYSNTATGTKLNRVGLVCYHIWEILLICLVCLLDCLFIFSFARKGLHGALRFKRELQRVAIFHNFTWRRPESF